MVPWKTIMSCLVVQSTIGAYLFIRSGSVLSNHMTECKSSSIEVQLNSDGATVSVFPPRQNVPWISAHVRKTVGSSDRVCPCSVFPRSQCFFLIWIATKLDTFELLISAINRFMHAEGKLRTGKTETTEDKLVIYHMWYIYAELTYMCLSLCWHSSWNLMLMLVSVDLAVLQLKICLLLNHCFGRIVLIAYE